MSTTKARHRSAPHTGAHPLAAANRVWPVLWVCVYAVLFLMIYRIWAAPTYAIYGLTDAATSLFPLALAFTAIVLTACTLPATIDYFSDYFSWMIFLLIVIPSTLIMSLQGLQSFSAEALIVAVFVAYFFIAGLPRFMRRPQSGQPRDPHNSYAFVIGFLLVYFAVTAIVIVLFRGTMTLSSLDDAAEQRMRVVEAGAGAIGGYLVAWLNYALNPYLIASGLNSIRMRLLAIFGIFGQLIVYMIIAAKLVIFSILGMILVYFFVARSASISSARLCFGLAAVTSTVLFMLWSSSFEPTGFALTVTSQLFMRALGIQGAMFGVYHDFFQYYPLTYGSHINGVNMFVAYPYDDPLGVVIGKHLVGGAGFNANANFLVTDGIASFGYYGVIGIGVMVGAASTFMDRIVTRDKLAFAMTMSLPYIMALANVSFFTSLITGGGIILAFCVAQGAITQLPQRTTSRSS